MAITKVHLLSIHLEPDYKHTLYFGSRSDQLTYFQKQIRHSFTDFTYQRKDNKIRIGAEYDTIFNCNYVMYQNSAYSDKWFYCFITDMKYISDGVTEITIETDVMQTYMFDIQIKKSFIEREHTDNDTVGNNTVPEELETGEYICNDLDRDLQLRDYTYVLCCTENIANPDNPIYGTNLGGIWSAGGFFVSDNATDIIALIREYDLSNELSSDSIVAFYMVPKKIVSDPNTDTMLFEGMTKPVTYEHTTAKQTTLNGYTPKNKKLLCYPYNYMLLSNNAGSSNILQYELFSTSDCTFEIEGIPTVGGSIKCVPMNYKGIERLQEEGIMCGKFPVLSWSQDAYTNWLTINAVNNTVGFVTDGLKVIGGTIGAVSTASTGFGAVMGAGTAISGVEGIISRMVNIHQHSFTPNSARGNTNGGDINTAYKMNTFYFYKMSIRKEWAQRIDDFFTMFGYKTNRVKIPNTNHRKRFWYTKTIDCEIDGRIPQKDLQKIKDCYNNGITFWKNGSEIGEFNLDNPVV